MVWTHFASLNKRKNKQTVSIKNKLIGCQLSCPSKSIWRI